ncbi:response regulator transcription factor [Actinoplanes sp. NPDC026619]|uniref:response regulator transcription factor n=1 Tax=Actinoplanes sp. NPDC026619 TaxID=3155798 RepID=UPI0033CA0580
MPDTNGSPHDSLPIGVCAAPSFYRAGMTTVLQAVPDLDVVVEFDSSGYRPRLLHDYRPRVLLIDLEGLDVENLLIRRVVPETARLAIKVIALSSDRHFDSAMRMLQSGAQAFLHRDTPVPRLIEAIRAVDDGGVVLDPHIARDVLRSMRTGGLPDTSVRLTRRQRQILGLLGLGLTNIEIADRLRLGRPTVKTHVSSLLRALDLRDRTQLAVFACTHDLRAHDGEPEY